MGQYKEWVVNVHLVRCVGVDVNDIIVFVSWRIARARVWAMDIDNN